MKRIKPILFVSSVLVILVSACSPASSPGTDQGAASKPELPTEAILFASDRNGEYGYYTMDTDGSNIQRIEIQGLPASALIMQPIWSKGAQKYFLSVRIDNDMDIYTMNWDGSGIENLTNSDFRWETDPAPSPDGELIAFVGVVDFGRDDDFRLQVDGVLGLVGQVRATVFHPGDPSVFVGRRLGKSVVATHASWCSRFRFPSATRSALGVPMLNVGSLFENCFQTNHAFGQ